ncbi:MAG TPA: segregation/condensation protein A [Dehalococcoidia bacterium]|nr:segregation/condensation protein A [Dehalococcoidia bacterium]
MLAVKTSVFEGPLDLLLHLIEREELEITAVSLVQVTDQYLALLRAQDQIDLRALAEFISVGAKLIFLKSRALLPRTAEQIAEDEREAEEIAEDLTAQLEEYRTFKQAASYLRELDDTGHRSFTRVAPPPGDFAPTGLERVTLRKLLKAFAKALDRLPPEPEPERVHRQAININDRKESILSAVKRRGRLGFSRLLAECKTRIEAIVTFLAILELLKTEELRAEQSASFGEIMLATPGNETPGFEPQDDPEPATT